MVHLINSGIVIDQTVHGGFRFRNIEEHKTYAEAVAATGDAELIAANVFSRDTDTDSVKKSKGSQEMIEKL